MRPDPAKTPPGLPTRRRVTVQEAAHLLGTTVEGVRSRIKRGTLIKDKDEDGTVYVLLDPDQTRPGADQTSPDADRTTDQADSSEALTRELIAELRAQNEHLRSELSIRNEELRRKDTILMTMAQRLPELEAPRDTPPEAPESPLSGSDGSVGDTHTPEPERPSWWQRIFGAS